MNLFEQRFKDSLKSNVSLLDKIMHYIIKRKGKQMRPMFVFLSDQDHLLWRIFKVSRFIDQNYIDDKEKLIAKYNEIGLLRYGL